MDHFAGGVQKLLPDFRDREQSWSDDRLVENIDATRPMMLEYSQVAESIAMVSGERGEEAARALYEGFTPLLDLYWMPRGYTDPFHDVAFDLAKFVGQEAFVALFALLICEDRWKLIADLLAEDLYVSTRRGSEPGYVDFTYVSEYVGLLDRRTQRLQLGWVSLHATLLNDRHRQGELADIVPMDRFVGADYFLYLRGQIAPETVTTYFRWRAWSTVYLDHMPRYLEAAMRVKAAERLVLALGAGDVPTLRERFSQRVRPVTTLFGGQILIDPLEDFDPQVIGSRP
jgi:hypothetical protein